MTATPQTNATLAEVARVLLGHDRFCLCGHVNPDGDCIGSQLALAAALRRAGKQVVCLLAGDDALNGFLGGLPGAGDCVPARSYQGACEVFVALDVPVRDRLGAAADVLDRAALSVTIDHHAADARMTDWCHVDPGAASTSLLVWRVAKLLGVDVTGDVAECALAGLMTDTGRFQYQNADAAAFAAASEMASCGADIARLSSAFYQSRSVASVKLEARVIERMRFAAAGGAVVSWIGRADMEELGAVKADAEPLVDVLRSLAGVHVACMLREQDDVVRGSLRAKDDTDVSLLAQRFGGGGHKAAAGFTLREPLADAVARMTALLDEAVAR